MQSLITLKQTLSTKEFADFLLNQPPLFYHETDKIWVATRREIAEHIYKSPDFSADRSQYFAQRMPTIQYDWIKDFLSVATKMMVMNNAPKHTAMRRICYHGLSQQIIKETVNQVEKKSLERIEALSSEQHIELMAQYIEEMSAYALSTLFQVPDSFRATFYQCANTMTQFFGGLDEYNQTKAEEVNLAALTLKHYFQQLLLEARQSEGHHVIHILQQEQKTYQLTDDELTAQCIMLLVAGQVTTADQFAMNLYQLLQHPTLWLTLGDEKHQAALMEELTRLEPSVCCTERLVKNPITLAGFNLKPGEVVLIANLVTNRDTDFYPQGNNIDITKSSNQHMSFGSGTHYCLGAKMARQIMQILLKHLHDNFPNMTLSEALPSKRKLGSLNFSGFETLHVRLF